MADRPRLIGIVLAGGVLLAHALVVEGILRHLDVSSGLARVAPVLFTRILSPEAPSTLNVTPAAVEAVSRPEPGTRSASHAVGSRPAASSPREGNPGNVDVQAQPSTVHSENGWTPSERALEGNRGGSGEVAQAEATALAPAPERQHLPNSSHVAPASAESMESWPVATRLSYRLDGRFRSGDLYGSAQVFWLRDGSNYQVRIDVDISLFASFSMVSQGVITADRLTPRVFEEVRPGRKRRMVRFGDSQLTLDNGTTVPKPVGVQDAASQFVQFTQDFSTGRRPLAAGQSLSVWMARPGGVDAWTYDVVALEDVQTPGFGAVSAFHLRPRPIANARGNITMEMWYAPSLNNLPIRIQLRMGEEAQLDLVAEKIELQ